MKRKTSPIDSTKRGFLFIPQALNRHYRDPRRLNKHQIPPNKHQTEQTGKENRCTRQDAGASYANSQAKQA
jgi:hypothetical protein